MSRDDEYDCWLVGLPAFFITEVPCVIYHEGRALQVTEVEQDGVDTTFTHTEGVLTVWHGDVVGSVNLWQEIS